MDKSAKDMLIRKIKPEDAEDIGRIQSAITKSSSKIDFRQIIKEQIRENKDISFVAEIDGKVVGYMISYIVFGGFGLEKSAWIVTMGVDIKYMGKGIGKRLADEIVRIYGEKGITHIHTAVRWDSVDLLSFFKTMGFDRSNFINLRKKLDY